MPLSVKIPWWYKPFIRFMLNFYEEVPELRYGLYYTTRVDIITHSFVNPVKRGKCKGKYTNTHQAYLRARWRAMWKDFCTFGSSTGVQWVILSTKTT